jgi:hypothetical protein
MHGANVKKKKLFVSALANFSLELGKSRNNGDPQEAQHAASPRV